MVFKNYRLGLFGFFLWVLVFYLFIFQPPVMSKLIYLALQFFVFIMAILFFHKRIEVFVNIFKAEFLLVFFVVFYSIFRDALSGDIVYSDRFVGWFFQSFLFCGVLVSLYFYRTLKKESLNYFGNEIYVAGFIAALFTLVLWLFPAVDSFYESIQLDAYYEIYSDFEKRYRAYGVSENLTYTYSVVLGICAGYSLILYRKSWFFVFLCPLFLFAVSVNARIGFLGFVFFVFYVFLYSELKAKAIWLFSFLVLSFWFYFSSGDFIQENRWSLGFFLEVADFFYYGLEGNNIIAVLLNSHVHFPETVAGVVFGTGESLFGSGFEKSSDIGYILQLNYGGVIILILLMLAIAFMSVRLFKILGYKHWFSWFFPISICVLNFKGFIFAMTPGGRFIFLLYFYYIFKALVVNNQIFLNARNNMISHAH
ncbi:hypothetical protein [Marinobacterium iners]|uniref:O-antigen ligase like membrane protein n=1 Tax=Marinobacterium iners DSM 11526 TaxID=1122198 RepID=A0A1H4BX39_9GAMM|nr:hypothetical protein [Marinobacterium iners]SEA52627.1 hypothetical protein SAMN02745729_10497 [Marinobacterium iners DSM 11526]